MAFNIFEGSRRIAYVLFAVITLGWAFVAVTTKPYVGAYFVIYESGGAPIRLQDDLPFSMDNVYETRDVSVAPDKVTHLKIYFHTGSLVPVDSDPFQVSQAGGGADRNPTPEQGPSVATPSPSPQVGQDATALMGGTPQPGKFDISTAKPVTSQIAHPPAEPVWMSAPIVNEPSNTAQPSSTTGDVFDQIHAKQSALADKLVANLQATEMTALRAQWDDKRNSELKQSGTYYLIFAVAYWAIVNTIGWIARGFVIK